MAGPRNFDEFYNGDNSFILGGATFHWRPLHWREWGEEIDGRIASEAEADKKRRETIDALVAGGKTLEDAESEVDNEETLVDSLQKVVERITIYLEPSEIESFKAIADDRAKRITIAQLQALQVWLQEVQTPERPTEAPAPSSAGRGTQGAISPAA